RDGPVDFLGHWNKFLARNGGFFEKMGAFVKTAIARKELIPMPKEIYWSIAFAPLYQMVLFHQSKFGLGGRPSGPGEKKFILDDTTLDFALKLVTKALKP